MAVGKGIPWLGGYLAERRLLLLAGEVARVVLNAGLFADRGMARQGGPYAG
jgi:hypothetical protein